MQIRSENPISLSQKEDISQARSLNWNENSLIEEKANMKTEIFSLQN